MDKFSSLHKCQNDYFKTVQEIVGVVCETEDSKLCKRNYKGFMLKLIFPVFLDLFCYP